MKNCCKEVTKSCWILSLLFGLAVGGAQARDASKSDGPANAATTQVSKETERILNSIKTTQYKHDTQIDEKKGLYLCDCSGFVGYVLQQTVAKNDPKNGPLGDGNKRPTASQFEKAFAKAPTKPDGSARWQRVERLADARPGDVIAWRHEKPMPGNTGHVVFVAERPVLESDGLVKVVIVDSTTKPMVDDTRAAGTSGIGRCTMWFTIDDEGRPHAHIRGSRKATPKVESISIGRAVPVAAKPAARRAA